MAEPSVREKISGADNFHRLRRELTDQEKNVLAAIHLNPVAEVPSISKVVKLAPHVVRHLIESLRHQRVIGYPVPFVDVYSLGYTEYAFYVTISNPPGADFDQAITTDSLLVEGVSLVAQTSGPYNFVIIIFAKSAAEAHGSFQKLSDRFACRIIKKTVSTRITYRLFGYRYFGAGLPGTYPVRHFGLNYSEKPIEIDPTDTRLLVAMGRGNGGSRREFARQLDVPSSTVDHRIKRLERLGVIQGYEYLFSPGTLGKKKYRFLMAADLRGGRTTEKLLALAAADPRVIVLNECLGDWEFELLIHLGEGESVTEFSDKLCRHLDGAVRTLHSVTNVVRHRLERFPFSESVAKTAAIAKTA
jgi:DNA-binding Lrp family transcriptional regulator